MVAVLQAACVRQAAAVPRACAAARPAAKLRPRSCFTSPTPAAFQHLAAARTARQWACGTSRRPAAAAAAASSEAATEEAVASPGDYCECHYTVSTEDGTVIDSSKASSSENEVKEIARFILGGGRVVAGFHQAVGGLAVGESRKHRVVPEDAYGERTDEMVVRIPKGQAPEGLEAGMVVGLTNGMQAVVTAVDEEAVTIDANHPLAGQALFFEVELTKRIPAAQLETATFGAGCFWSVELAFQRVPGVVQTAVGFSQGVTAATTYELVCTGSTGHNEVVQVVYDPSEVSYEQLLDAFWAKHDPTTLNRQGGDVGTQYRSGIYWHTEEQRRIAEASLAAQNERLGGTVVTEIEQVKNFSEAEEYHQRYLEKGGRNGQAQSAAKGCTDPIRCYG